MTLLNIWGALFRNNQLITRDFQTPKSVQKFHPQQGFIQIAPIDGGADIALFKWAKGHAVQSNGGGCDDAVCGACLT